MLHLLGEGKVPAQDHTVLGGRAIATQGLLDSEVPACNSQLLCLCPYPVPLLGSFEEATLWTVLLDLSFLP